METMQVITKNGFDYIIEKSNTNNRWFYSYVVYKVNDNGVEFIGKYQAPNIDAVIDAI